MRYTIQTETFNQRRFSRPWIARVTTWPVGQKPTLQFGNHMSARRPGDTGELEIEAQPGDIIRWGQRDYRGSRTSQQWAITEEDGTVTRCDSLEARIHSLQRPTDKTIQHTNTLDQYTTDELLAEIKRRQNNQPEATNGNNN